MSLPMKPTFNLKTKTKTNTNTKTKTETKTETKTKTKTKFLKYPTCAIFLKSLGFEDIKYDILTGQPDQTRVVKPF